MKTTSFLNYASNSRSKLNPKNLEYCSVDIGKWEACAKFQQKIFNSAEVGAHQSFQFFRHFSPKQCLNFVWEFALLNYYHQIIKISVLKTQLYINQASHLNVNIYLFIYLISKNLVSTFFTSQNTIKIRLFSLTSNYKLKLYI